MDMTDINASENNSHISATETETDTITAPNSEGATTQSQGTEQYTPFKNGKEKFTFKDGEHEWDWETTKKYAELGRGGRLALQRAHEVEKKATEAYKKLLHHAQSDPYGLLKILNPQFEGSSQHTAKTATAHGNESEQQGQDPREAEIHQLKSKLGSVEEILERQEIEKEKQAIETELSDSIKKFPELDNKIHRAYIKQQYKQALTQGLDLSIEDVAFYVNQEIKEMESAKLKAQKEKQQQINKKAPVSSVPGKSVGEGGGYSREDVMRMAGRLV